MGLDITISRIQEIKCPNCGEVVARQPVDYVYSNGRVWFEFLHLVGYEDEQYGKDIGLSGEQLGALIEFVNENNFYCKGQVESLVAIGLLNDEKIVINANW